MGLGLGITNEPLEYPTGWLPDEDGLNTFIRLWLQGGVGVATNAWIDSSGFQSGATQSLSGNAPTLLGVTPEGLNFDQSGVPQFMDFEQITVGQNSAFTLVFVVKLNSTVNQVLLSDSGNEFIEILSNKNFRIKTNNPSNLTTVLKSDVSVFNASLSIIFLSRQSNGKFQWRLNGEKINYNTSTSVNQVNTGGFDIQNLCIRNDSDRAVSGEVREVIFYDEIALGELQYQSKMVNLHNYLADKFDITIELTDLF
tara:strand:- start:1169 stop:1930 length:762 start_codon:yes stop_codon:yes gene_type:complete